MSLPVLSQQDYYNIFKNAMTDEAPDLTDWNEGSTDDILAGVWSLVAVEITKRITDQFKKCFVDLAEGPEETGGLDDLQTLAVDHFGNTFARPGAVAAIDVATFARANNTGGVVLIPAGTVVKTKPDANGVAQRYTTDSDVTMTASSIATDTSVAVPITAVVKGAAGSASVGTITILESTLTDSTITVTNAGNATGLDAESTPDYRDTIHNLIESLAGATLAAIEATAKTVPGIKTATAVENVLKAKLYNPNTNTVSGNPFSVSAPTLYVADATGTASPALLALVRAAIQNTKAGGVIFTVASAVAHTVNWTVAVTLNPAGPNFPTFSTDLTIIKSAMADYINGLGVGISFVRATAEAAIRAQYGPAGTNDLTAFVTSVPSGDVAAAATTKMVAGTMATS